MGFEAEKLRESIFKVGQLEPVYFWGSVLLDGAKRAEACRELGIDPVVRRVETLEEAAAITWAKHPDRALRMFKPATLTEAAELFKAPMSSLAKHYRPKKPRKPSPTRARRSSWAKRGGKAVLVQVPPGLKGRVDEMAKRLGITSAEVYRAGAAYCCNNPWEVVELLRIQGPTMRKRGRPRKQPRSEPKPVAFQLRADIPDRPRVAWRGANKHRAAGSIDPNVPGSSHDDTDAGPAKGSH